MLPGQLDMLADITSPSTSTSLRGLSVRLERRACRCGSHLAVIGSSRGIHHAELLCASCRMHMGWLPGEAYSFLGETLARFGAPDHPIVLRDRPTGGNMDRKPDTGTLFKNDKKQNPKAPDYRGYVNAAGVNYEIAGWINESPKAGKFIRFQLKVKDEVPVTVPRAAANRDFDDPIGF